MKLFRNQRTQNERRIYICGICVYKKERKLAREIRKKRESLRKYDNIFSKLLLYSQCECQDSDFKSVTNKRNVASDTVWQLWLQGEEKAPELVKRCIQSVRENTQGRPHVLLTQENLSEYLDVPPYILNKYKQGKFSTTHFSDIIRLLLLEQYGGSWIDATVMLTSPLPQDVLNSSVFVFKTPDWCHFSTIPDDYTFFKHLMPFSNPYHCCSSWFIHVSSPENRLIRKALNIILAYWKHEDKLVDYYLLHLCLTVAVISDNIAKTQYEKMPQMSNHFPHILQNILAYPYDDKVFSTLKSISFAHKLTYHHDESLFSEKSYYREIMKVTY